MPERETIENLKQVRLFAAVIALALVIMMAFAMFSTRTGSFSNRPSKERQGLGGQLHTFQNNVDRSIHRNFGEVL